MAHAFDTDPLGALLEYTGLMRDNPVRPSPQQQAWESVNLGPPQQDTWDGPAMIPSSLLLRLTATRDPDVAKRELHRALTIAEAHHLIEPFSADANPNTRYRVLSSLGRELLEEESYWEYVGGAVAVVKKWRASVVKICHPTDAGIGTGFLIGPTTIATARHVVEGIQDFVVEFDGDVRASHSGFIAHPDKDIDLAIIRLEQASNRQPFRLSPGADLLDEVVVFGYPPVPLTGDAYLVVNRGEVSARVNFRNGNPATIVSCLLRGGNSGGPVVDRRGRIVGVVSRNLFQALSADERSINEGLGFAAAVPSVLLHAWVPDPV